MSSFTYLDSMNVQNLSSKFIPVNVFMVNFSCMKNLLNNPKLARLIWHEMVKHASLPRLILADAFETDAHADGLSTLQLKELLRQTTVNQLYSEMISLYSSIELNSLKKTPTYTLDRPLVLLRSFFTAFINDQMFFSGSDGSIVLPSQVHLLVLKCLVYLGVEKKNAERGFHSLEYAFTQDKKTFEITVRSADGSIKMPKECSVSCRTMTEEMVENHRNLFLFILRTLAKKRGDKFVIHKTSDAFHLSYKSRLI